MATCIQCGEQIDDDGTCTECTESDAQDITSQIESIQSDVYDLRDKLSDIESQIAELPEGDGFGSGFKLSSLEDAQSDIAIQINERESLLEELEDEFLNTHQI